MNILITGGGTGGHLVIAKTIREELLKRGIKPIYVGSETGQDREWFGEDTGFEQKYFLPTRGVVNQKGFAKLRSLLRIFKAVLRCRKIFSEYQIDTVFSVGGFSAAPASVAAVLSGKPLYIHEQNAVKGSLNKLLAPYAKAFFSSYHKESALKDYPVAQLFFDSYRERREIKTVIFLGGSQGAVAINDLALKVVPELLRCGIKVIHQAGKRDIERMRKYYESENLDVDVFDFDKNLIDKIKEADFAISRAGASTLWELTATGLPALFVPFPYAAGDHQYHNAKFLADRNLGFVRRQNELDESYLLECMDRDIAAISAGLKNVVAPDGAKKIVDYILE